MSIYSLKWWHWTTLVHLHTYIGVLTNLHCCTYFGVLTYLYWWKYIPHRCTYIGENTYLHWWKYIPTLVYLHWWKYIPILVYLPTYCIQDWGPSVSLQNWTWWMRERMQERSLRGSSCLLRRDTSGSSTGVLANHAASLVGLWCTTWATLIFWRYQYSRRSHIVWHLSH